jgi:hypothetical protein
MAARGARLRKYGVGRNHRAAEKRRTVGSCMAGEENHLYVVPATNCRIKCDVTFRRALSGLYTNTNLSPHCERAKCSQPGALWTRWTVYGRRSSDEQRTTSKTGMKTIRRACTRVRSESLLSRNSGTVACTLDSIPLARVQSSHLRAFRLRKRR